MNEYFSNCISLIFQKRTFEIIIWWIECWIIPRRFNSVSRQNKMLKNENSRNYSINRHSYSRSILDKLIRIIENKISQPSQCNKNTDNISFSSPLPSLPPHEILSNYNSSKFIPFKFEPRHIVKHRVY